MKKRIMRERPFEYFRLKDGSTPLPEEAVKNWYIARAFVLEMFKDISFAPGCNCHLHVTVDGDSPLMLSVLRQVALSAHYPNFVEYDANQGSVCRNRTVITLLTKREDTDILAELGKEEYLCNLLKYCKHAVSGAVVNEDSFLDIELEIKHDMDADPNGLVFRQEDVMSFMESVDMEDIYSIDTSKAIFASKAYKLGAVIDNLTYENIYSAGRYNKALDTFQFKFLDDKKKNARLVSKKWEDDINAVRNGLSNVLCADCFESRELSVKKSHPGYEKLSARKRKAVWEKCNDALSLSEHSRWVVEKLILGYSPFSKSQRLEYESLFGKRREAYRDSLKNNVSAPAHLDMCSYWDLHRVDPDDMKYDSFLMLAIPLILEKIRHEDKHK